MLSSNTWLICWSGLKVVGCLGSVGCKAVCTRNRHQRQISHQATERKTLQENSVLSFIFTFCEIFLNATVGPKRFEQRQNDKTKHSILHTLHPYSGKIRKNSNDWIKVVDDQLVYFAWWWSSIGEALLHQRGYTPLVFKVTKTLGKPFFSFFHYLYLMSHFLCTAPVNFATQLFHISVP